MKIQTSIRKNILLVDDESDVLLVLKRGLENAGYRVDAFSDPTEALASFKPNYYTRIIADIRMPSINGFELTRRIWSIDNKAKICFMSSFDIHENEARKLMPNLKSYCFLKKPIITSELVRHIEAHMLGSQAG